MKKLLLAFMFLLQFIPLFADKILSKMDVSSGDWVLIGVPVHNYRLLPVQEEMGTFICKDNDFIKKIQKEWDLEYTNEDKCDYHYTLKFYKDRKLMKTLKLNLYCGYITDDGISYSFNPELFDKFKSVAKPVPWSRISFKDFGVMKKALTVLDNSPDVYWYEDVNPYQYDGFFMMGVNNIPWDADLDSLYVDVKKMVEQKTGSNNFYLTQSHYELKGDNLFIRYLVNCDEEYYKKTNAEKTPGRITGWKPHFEKGDSVRVVAIGVNESKYRKLMGF